MPQFRLRFAREYTLAILSGVLLGFAYPPYGIVGGFFAFVGLVPLFFAIQRTTRFRETLRIAWVGMFVFGLVATYWVGGWNGEGNVDGFLMLGGVLLMLVHPFFLVVPFLLFDVTRRRFGVRWAFGLLPVFYAGFEYFHSFGDLSFPWLSLYNTQTYNTALIQFIALTGPYALTMLLVTINILCYYLVSGTRRPKQVGLVGACLVALIGIPFLYGTHVLNEPEPRGKALTMTVLQPNINPWAKWQADENRVMDTNYIATKRAIADAHSNTELIIWPETAIPFAITSPTETYHLDQFYKFLDSIHLPILTGFPDMEFYLPGQPVPDDAKPTHSEGVTYRSWNSAMLNYRDDHGRHIERYHKQVLVPLGEHVPFIDQFPIFGKIFSWTVGMGSWNRGTGYDLLRLPMAQAGWKHSNDTAVLSTLICYESIYPSFVRHFVDGGAEALVIITNDGWYGKSPGPFQHDQFAVLRAVENRRWIARSANTGISSFIDDKGRFVAQSPLFEQTSLTQRVPLLDEKTIYTSYGDFIAIPACWLTAALALYYFVTWIIERRKQKRLRTLTTRAISPIG
jgi:apolipoprotein N-acyltransferase